MLVDSVGVHMKIVYLGRPSRRTTPSPSPDGDVIELLHNNWDDFGFKTSFPVTARINGKNIDLQMVQLLVHGARATSVFLDQLLKEGWDGTFPIPGADYISVPLDITFYEQLEGLLGQEGVVKVAEQLRDASYLTRTLNDESAIALTQTDGFSKSLQRERGSIKAYIDGWKIFSRHDIAVLDLGFDFKNIFGNTTRLQLNFQPKSPLPHDVNVLIGPNGYGKSRVLHQIVQHWISLHSDDDIGFLKKPNLSQIVVVSYSPFELFPVDLARQKLKDTDAYRYFGFRGRGVNTKDNKLGKIRVSHEFPRKNAAHSLINCLRDDKQYKSIRDWAYKVRTVENVLKTAFEFDFAAIEIASKRRVRSLYQDTSLLAEDSLSLSVGSRGNRQRFVPISFDRIEELDDNQLRKAVIAESGVTFFHDGAPIQLSSGQRLFAYIVINVLGAIRRNSLILVDEPEIFLHPTLEIQFIDMLKKILASFNSKALLATHSVVTVREMPADCVHVFEKTEDDLLVNKPPFQTFGGDIQRISSYVFGDNSVSKPFERWIDSKLDEYESAEHLIEGLGEDVNEELVVLIRAMGRD
jgi:energy-coupling factor transporter ATP-binding protein EcfA2